jgi:type II secretory pathway pseudopilin PulG
MGHLEAGNPQRAGRLERVRKGHAGFTILELLLICTVAGIAMGVSMFALGASLNSSRANAALALVKQRFSEAREMAISQQRDIRIEFLAPNEIRIIRVNRPAGSPETVINSSFLEGNMTFMKLDGMPETPDPWGGMNAVAFGTAVGVRFRSGDGALVDENDEYVNGRVFIGRAGPNNVNSAGMVSIFGPTGRIRSYRLQGENWNY